MLSHSTAFTLRESHMGMRQGLRSPVRFNLNWRRWLHDLVLRCAHKIDAEHAHTLALWALRSGFASFSAPVALPTPDVRLHRSLFGKKLAHPIALAAGFDKNAKAYSELSALGFSAIEVGSATLHPHKGNSGKRLWRIEGDAIINRYGLNNNGLDALKRSIAKSPPCPHSLLGVSVASLEQSLDAILSDFRTALDSLRTSGADYIALNLSCPNVAHTTQPLFDSVFYQKLGSIIQKNKVPVLLKIPCDLQDKRYATITRLAIENGFAGLIVGNTSPKHEHPQQGGISGAPLNERANHALSLVNRARGTRGAERQNKKFVLISSGGVMDGIEAYRRLCNGADLVQVYTAFIYQGLTTLPNFICAMNKACQKTKTTKRPSIRNAA